jgi:outer membrane lipoprotein-sorting protein
MIHYKRPGLVKMELIKPFNGVVIEGEDDSAVDGVHRYLL